MFYSHRVTGDSLLLHNGKAKLNIGAYFDASSYAKDFFSVENKFGISELLSHSAERLGVKYYYMFWKELSRLRVPLFLELCREN